MKTVSAMELRRRLGEIVDEVRLKSQPVVLERAGRPMVRIVPCDPEETSDSESTAARRLRAVMDLYGCGAGRPRAADVGEWLDAERRAWDARPER